MALLWSDGFDHYGASVYMAPGAYTIATNTQEEFVKTDPQRARTGKGSLLVTTWNNNSAELQKSLAPGVNFGFGFGLLILYGSPPSDIRSRINFGLASGGNWIFSVFPNPDFSIGFSLGLGTYNQAVASSAPGLLSQGYCWIEVRAFIDAAHGSIEIRVNGAVALLRTNLNLGNVPADNFHVLKANEVNSAWGAVYGYMDDLVLWDLTGQLNNDFFGSNTKCRTSYLASNLSQQDWIANGGIAYQVLGNVPPLTNSQNITGHNVGDVSAFGIQQFPTTISYARGVTVFMQGNRTGQNPASFVPAIDIAGNKYFGSVVNPTQTAGYYVATFEADPITHSYWSLSDLNRATLEVDRTL